MTSGPNARALPLKDGSRPPRGIENARDGTAVQSVRMRFTFPVQQTEPACEQGSAPNTHPLHLSQPWKFLVGG